jgi:hypothetical protein
MAFLRSDQSNYTHSQFCTADTLPAELTSRRINSCGECGGPIYRNWKNEENDSEPVVIGVGLWSGAEVMHPYHVECWDALTCPIGDMNQKDRDAWWNSLTPNQVFTFYKFVRRCGNYDRRFDDITHHYIVSDLNYAMKRCFIKVMEFLEDL